MGIEAAVFGLASIAGKVAESKQQKRAAKKEKKAQRVQQAITEAQAQRERREAIQQQQQQQAQLANQGVLQGVGGSSGVQGGIGSIGTQTASNIGFQQGQLAGQQQISDLSQSAADARGQGALFGALGGVAQQGFQDAGGFRQVFKGFF